MGKIKEPIIYEFDPVIYPRKLWVCIGQDEKAIKEHFCDKNAQELSFYASSEYWAITFDEVFRVDTKKKGELVVFKSKNNMRMGVIAHEASHVVDGIEKAIGMTHGDEPSAYLFEWVCKSINMARLGRCEPIKFENESSKNEQK